MLKKAACSTNGQLISPTRNRWAVHGLIFLLQRLAYTSKTG